MKIHKEVECGRLVKEVDRAYGISDATYYNWKAKYGGMWSAPSITGPLVITKN